MELFTTSLEDLDFSDDLALLSHRIHDMSDSTQALEVQVAKVGLKINATKTKLIRIGTNGVSVLMVCRLYIRGGGGGKRKWKSSHTLRAL